MRAGSRFHSPRSYEFMCRPERQNARTQLLGKAMCLGSRARGQADDGPQNREDVLDAVRQFLRNDLALLGCNLGLVNVGAGAEPADDAARIVAHRKCAAKRPAIFARTMPKPVFDLVWRAGFQRMPPQLPRTRLIIR